jgi:hypothetical protein
VKRAFHAASVVAVAVALAAPAKADFLTILGYQTLNFQLKSVLTTIVPELAVAPNGETLLAACEVGANNVVTLKLWFFDAAGTLVTGPTTVTTVGTMAGMKVAAGPTAFCVVMDITGAPGDSNSHGVFFRTFTLAGAPLSASTQIQANTFTSLDERSPSVAGYPTPSGTSFVITWVRAALTTGGSTSGVYARRFTSLGAAVDPVEIRVDGTSVGAQNIPTVAAWPNNGRFVVAWMDGQPFPATGPLGSGTGVFARVMNGDFTFRTGQLTIPSVTADDQVQPFLAVNQADVFVCGWTSFVNATTLDAFARRFTDLGVALDANDVDLTTAAATGGHVLTSLAMTPSGEYAAATDALGPSGVYTTKHSRYTRRAPSATNPIVEDGMFVVSPSPSDQLNARLKLDQWGGAFLAYVVDTGSAVGLVGSRANRSMLFYDNNAPPIGSTISVFLDSPETPNLPFVLGCAMGPGPIAIDTRSLPLAGDLLLFDCLSGVYPSVFINFVGTLDAIGFSVNSQIAIPNLPVLIGINFYCAFGVLDVSWPGSVRTISHNAVFTPQ